jgi:phosphatidylserine/phosphatidylglycerophosphate/cardiolipin synthase-like enzyme
MIANEAVVEIADAVIDRVVDALGNDRPAAVRRELSNLLSAETSPSVARLIEAAGDHRTAAVALAAASAATRAAAAAAERIQVVWTGPDTIQVPVQPTTTVVHELIAKARSRLTLATYSAADVKDLVSLLHGRRKDGIDIRLLLETRRSDGKGPDSVSPFKTLLPFVEALKWPRAARPDALNSSMHVKVVVCDEVAVLVTSANLSRTAQFYGDKRGSMELGLLIEGPETARRIQAHFDELVDSGVLVPIDIGKDVR